MNLSTHFTLEEATYSGTASRLGIDNSVVSPEVLESAKHTAAQMEKIRSLLGAPIRVNSWIRCQKLNRALLSHDTSQHILGEAVDFVCPAFGDPIQICSHLLANKVLVWWDQLIYEHSWVHISWKSAPDAKQRGSVLTLLKGGKYEAGLVVPSTFSPDPSKISH